MNILYYTLNLPLFFWIPLLIGMIILFDEISTIKREKIQKTKQPQKHIPGIVWLLRDMRMRGFDTAAFAKWYMSPNKDLGADFNRFQDKSMNNFAVLEPRHNPNMYIDKYKWVGQFKAWLLFVQMPIPIRNQNKQS